MKKWDIEKLETCVQHLQAWIKEEVPHGSTQQIQWDNTLEEMTEALEESKS